MNESNLHAIIDRYENDLDVLCDEHNELFKWRAVKAWQDAFHSSDSPASFREKFSSAKKHFSFFMDNGYQHPSTGVIKLWEKEPDATEHLFREVLLSDFDGDVSRAERSMLAFLNGYEDLRVRYFPEFGSYKMTPHIASVFMIMDQPWAYYVFRISAARRLAASVGFDGDLGTGTKPNLVNYYRLCDIVASALSGHAALLEKHFSRLTDQMYIDRSLHLMVFDLMHCNQYRRYDTGMAPSPGRKAKKQSFGAGRSEDEAQRKEQERLDRISGIRQRIRELELSVDDFEEISLIGVEVSFARYGRGTVISQADNRIAVQFPDTVRDFKLESTQPVRPRFENDDEIVKAFTIRARVHAEIRKLKEQLDKLT